MFLPCRLGGRLPLHSLIVGRPKLIGPLTASETIKKQQRKQWYERNKTISKKRAAEAKIRTQDWFKSIKSQEKCSECGHDVYEDLDYHHRDPSTKITTVSDMVGRYSRRTILNEMKKCVILCKNCHMKHHYNYPFH